MGNDCARKALGRLHFLRMLLSMNYGAVKTDFKTFQNSGKRSVQFNLSMTVDEEYYQLCLDLALQHLVSSRHCEGGRLG